MALVIDASALVAALLGLDEAERVRSAMEAAEGTLVAPELLDIEVMSALRRATAGGRLSEQRGAAAVHDLAAVGIARCHHGPLLPRMWELRHNLTAYDAAYIALAEAVDAPLLTLDTSLASAPGNKARVVVA